MPRPKAKAGRKAAGKAKSQAQGVQAASDVMNTQEAVEYSESEPDGQDAARFCAPYYTSHIYGHNQARAVPPPAPVGVTRRLRVMTSQEAVESPDGQ